MKKYNKPQIKKLGKFSKLVRGVGGTSMDAVTNTLLTIS